METLKMVCSLIQVQIKDNHDGPNSQLLSPAHYFQNYICVELEKNCLPLVTP